jgi:hypothetical protein
MKLGAQPARFSVPMRSALAAAPNPPPAWSRIIGTPRCAGENQTYGDCVPTAAVNASITAAAREGIMSPIANTLPFDIYQTLGGMPADVGLDPTTLITYWRATPIAGYRLVDIEALSAWDTTSIKAAIASNGFVYLCVELDLAQQNQIEWTPMAGSPVWGGHAICADGYEADYLTVTSWGSEYALTWDFLAAQASDVWRIELEKI